MAIDAQQERSQGFILYPKHDQYPQPVPFASLPGAAGQLPAWEQKKLELEMASAGMNGGNDDDEEEEEQPRAESVKTAARPDKAPTPVLSQPLPKQSSLRRSGSAFFSSLRSPSSRNNSGIDSNSRTRTPSANGYNSPRTIGNGMPNGSNNGSTVQVHRDPSGGIGTSPRATHKKRSSSLMLYLKRHFGIENHPEYDPSAAAARSSASSAPRSSHAAGTGGGGGANKLKKSPSQRLAATSSYRHSNAGIGNTPNNNRKTRSSGFADKMRLASGKLSTKAKQTWKRFNSRSKPEEVPQTWEEWRAAYARGQIDVSDLPPPPPTTRQRQINGNGNAQEGHGVTEPESENPYEQEFLPAPMPEDHRRRQLAFNRLDIEGKRGGVKPSEIAVPAGEDPLPDTLEGHPA